MTKPCRTCRIEKPLTEFYKHGAYHSNECKACRKQSLRSWKKLPKMSEPTQAVPTERKSNE